MIAQAKLFLLFIGHKRILPKSFVKPEIVEGFAKEYMFLGCIKYINEVCAVQYRKEVTVKK